MKREISSSTPPEYTDQKPPAQTYADFMTRASQVIRRVEEATTDVAEKLDLPLEAKPTITKVLFGENPQAQINNSIVK